MIPWGFLCCCTIWRGCHRGNAFITRFRSYKRTAMYWTVFGGCFFVCFIARKRGLGQGNIFRSVCQSFCPEREACLVGRGACMAGGVLDRGHVWQEVCVTGGMCGKGGMFSKGVCVPERQPLKRAVRFLLECILVLFCSVGCGTHQHIYNCLTFSSQTTLQDGFHVHTHCDLLRDTPILKGTYS